MAFNTPFKMWKRYEFNGGTSDPCTPLVRGSRGQPGLPPDDRSALEIILTPRPQLTDARNRYTYYPGTAEIPETQAVNVRNRSFTVAARMDIPSPSASGVLFAQGALFGGHAPYVKDKRLHYVNNFVGLTEQKIDASEDLPVGENLILSASFEGRRRPAARGHRDPVAVPRGQESRRGTHQDPARNVLARRGGLCVGRDSGAPVTADYAGDHGAPFTGGTIKRVAVDVSGDLYVDMEREAQAMLARE
jgi:hypothetical protein